MSRFARSLPLCVAALPFISTGDELPAASASSGVHSSSLQHRSQIEKARRICVLARERFGCPGLSVAVSVGGQLVWSRGFGFADVENQTRCTDQTVMRIASISKPLTMLAVATLVEEGRLDLDAPVQKYVSGFPEKTFDGKSVKLNTRHLVSNKAGIRHYYKRTEGSEIDTPEYYLTDHFDDVKDSLKLFSADPLLFEPGTSFKYSTYGWTLVSAVVQAAADRPFQSVMTDLFHRMGMRDTHFEQNKPLILNRARFYRRNKNTGRLENTDYIDNSYKYAGGGLMSNVVDLVRFANTLLAAYHGVDRESALLKRATVELMWTPVDGTSCSWDKPGGYAMGWGVVTRRSGVRDTSGACGSQRKLVRVSHTGGAVGASSVLLIVPGAPGKPQDDIVVVLVANMQDVNLSSTALDISNVFKN